eukprot:2736106-Rhodomonas_salina.2
MSGTDEAYAATQFPVLALPLQTWAMLLRLWYGVCNTKKCYGATAGCGTELCYAATRLCCYAMCGTEKGYAATAGWVRDAVSDSWLARRCAMLLRDHTRCPAYGAKAVVSLSGTDIAYAATDSLRRCPVLT